MSVRLLSRLAIPALVRSAAHTLARLAAPLSAMHVGVACIERMPAKTARLDGVGVGPTPFRAHVGDVVELRPQKQMRRIATGRIVALVKDACSVEPFAFGNRPVGQRPRHAMRQRNVSFLDHEASVAVRVACRSPRPALVIAIP